MGCFYDQKWTISCYQEIIYLTHNYEYNCASFFNVNFIYPSITNYLTYSYLT